jgi:hypothetical protein
MLSSFDNVRFRVALRVSVAAEGRCGAGRVGLQSLSAAQRAYALPSIEATLRSGLIPNFGAAARMASAM